MEYHRLVVENYKPVSLATYRKTVEAVKYYPHDVVLDELREDVLLPGGYVATW